MRYTFFFLTFLFKKMMEIVCWRIVVRLKACGIDENRLQQLQEVIEREMDLRDYYGEEKRSEKAWRFPV